MKVKRCKKCQEVFNIDNFYINNANKDGHTSYCKSCDLEKRSLLRNKSPEKYKKAMKTYYHSNKDKWKNIRLKNEYGISLNDYNKMFKDQNGLCLICEQPETSIDHKYKTRKSLCVDHCHETGKIRGLLCQRCNSGIGQLKHDKKRLSKAIDYLNKFDNQ